MDNHASGLPYCDTLYCDGEALSSLPGDEAQEKRFCLDCLRNFIYKSKNQPPIEFHDNISPVKKKQH